MSRMLLAVIVLVVLVFPSLAPVFSGEEKEVALTTIKIGESEGVNPKEKFASYYKPVEYKAEAKIEPYALPLDPAQITNFKDFTDKIKLDDAALALLKKNGIISTSRILSNMIFRSFKIFWKSYVKRQGYKEGYYGMAFATLFSFINFLKWAKYWELTRIKNAGR